MAIHLTYYDGRKKKIEGGIETRKSGENLIIIGENNAEIATIYDHQLTLIIDVRYVDDTPPGYRKYPCQLCDCEDFDEAHMGDIKCYCHHDQEHHG